MEPASKTQDVATKLEKTGLGKVLLPSVFCRAQDSLHLQSPRFGRAARIGQSSLLSVSDEPEELQPSTSQPAVDTTPVSPDRQQITGNASVKKVDKDTSDLVRVLSEDLDSASIGKTSPTQVGLNIIYNKKGKPRLIGEAPRFWDIKTGGQTYDKILETAASTDSETEIETG